MKSQFVENYKNKFVNEFKNIGINKDLAERVYTSRLLGNNKDLVLHGGGNTSVKSIARDTQGEKHDVIFIKGSGSDLSSIKPEDFPAVKLNPLKKIIQKNNVTDDEMVKFLRQNLIDSSSPNPSVETLVHSIINEKFVDHTHSNAILEITNRKDGYNLCKKIFGNKIIIIPYVMPGFLLARKVSQLYKSSPQIHGMILYRHGIFSYGATAKESYNRMIKLVSMAEKYLSTEKTKKIKKINEKNITFKSPDIAPLIRGAISHNKSYILNFRTNQALLDVINIKDAKKILSRGVVTPDHVIRTKPKYLVINIDDCRNHRSLEIKLKKEISRYSKNYVQYFKTYNKFKNQNILLDPIPQIIVIQNLGLFSVGINLDQAVINGDVAEAAIKIIGSIEKRSKFKSISMKDIFNVEYWSLEQAKIKKDAKPLSGKVTLVTGGTGVIGLATAKKFKKMGSEVIIIDINRKKILSEKNKGNFDAYYCDVRKRKEFKKILNNLRKKYGGIDIVISNAGNAIQNEISTVSDAELKKSFETNFFSHQIVASESVEIMKMQKKGGCLLFNISKQAINPGFNFGPYGLPKSALMSLCRQYALEYGSIGIRSNGVNADRIVSGLLTKEMIKKRAKSRNIRAEEYLKGNLLKKQVLAEDVADAFYNLSISEKTTAAVFSVDGGNIEASMR